MITLTSYWGWLALTVFLEAGLGALAWPGLGGLARRVGTIAAVNLLSHPLASIAVMEGIPWGGAEVAVVGLEGLLLAWALRVPWIRALAAACTLNGLTAALGLVLG